jgi:ribose 5-phosphate isomerase A
MVTPLVAAAGSGYEVRVKRRARGLCVLGSRMLRRACPMGIDGVMSTPEYDGPLGLREMKRIAARAALEFVEPGSVIGVGSGTTVAIFIDALAESRIRLGGAVSAPKETTRHLRQIGVDVIELDGVTPTLYVDGADQIDTSGRALKGQGGALTREKLVAQSCEYWACIVDATKVRRALCDAPVSLEVGEAMVESVQLAVGELGGKAVRRAGALTDGGNPLFDVEGLDLGDPEAMEDALDAIPGVIGNGIFAHRRADVILVGRAVGSVGRIVPNSMWPVSF